MVITVVGGAIMLLILGLVWMRWGAGSAGRTNPIHSAQQDDPVQEAPRLESIITLTASGRYEDGRPRIFRADSGQAFVSVLLHREPIPPGVSTPSLRLADGTLIAPRLIQGSNDRRLLKLPGQREPNESILSCYYPVSIRGPTQGQIVSDEKLLGSLSWRRLPDRPSDLASPSTGAAGSDGSTGAGVSNDAFTCERIELPGASRRILGCDDRGRLFFLSGPGSLIYAYDPEARSFTKVAVFPGADPVVAVGGSQLLAYQDEDRTLTILDANGGNVLQSLRSPIDGDICGMAMSPKHPDLVWLTAITTNEKGKRRLAHATLSLKTNTLVNGEMDLGHASDQDRRLRLALTPDLQYGSIGPEQFGGSAFGMRDPTTTGVRVTERSDYRNVLCSDGRLIGDAAVYADDHSTAITKVARQATVIAVPGSELILSLNTFDGEVELIHPAKPVSQTWRMGSLPKFKRSTGLLPPGSVVYRPTAGHLLVLEPDGAHLLHATAKLGRQLARSGQPHLLIAAEPPPLAVRGRQWTHHIQASGSSDGIELALSSGPEGMELAQDGTLTWHAPARLGDPVDVVVRVTSSEQSRFHTFSVRPGIEMDGRTVPVERIEGMAPEHEFLRLEGPVLSTRIAQDGRFVVCHIPSADHLAVVDLIEYRCIARIPISDSDLFTAGGQRIAIYDESANRISIHDLVTGNQIGEVPNPVPCKHVACIEMGYNRDDRLIISGLSPDGKLVIDLVEIPSGKAFGVLTNLTNTQIFGTRPLMVQPNANLEVAGAMCPTLQPSGVILLEISEQEIRASAELEDAGHLYPGEDRTLIGDRSIYSFDLKELGRFEADQAVNYELALRPIVGSSLLTGSGSEKVWIFSRDDSEPVSVLSNIPGGTSERSLGVRRGFACPQHERCHMSETVGRGFIVPGRHPGLIITQGVSSSVDDKDRPLLAVSSTLQAVGGRKWVHQVTFAHRPDGTEVSLLNAPEGMNISDEGLISWFAPSDFREPLSITVVAVAGDARDMRQIIIEPMTMTIGDAQSWELGAPDRLLLPDDAKSVCEPGSAYALVTSGRALYAIEAASLRPLAKTQLDNHVACVAIRGASAYVATGDALIEYALPNLRPIQRYELPCVSPTDIAPHPRKRLIYVAGSDPSIGDKAKQKRILVVNQSTGRIQWLQNVYGQRIGLGPDGKKLFSCLSTSFSDSSVVMDGWGRAFEVTQHSLVSLLSQYQLSGGASAEFDIFNDKPGAKVRDLIVAPDGEAVSVVSAFGYRTGNGDDSGYNVPAFSARNITHCITTYDVEDEPQSMAFHPTLELVLAGNEQNLWRFNRATGKRIGHEMLAPAGMTSLDQVAFGGSCERAMVSGISENRKRTLLLLDLGLEGADLRKARIPVESVELDDGTAADDHQSPALAPPATEGGLWKVADLRIPEADLDSYRMRPGTTEMDPADIARRYAPAVVLIRHDRGIGTGFIIGDNGYILTNAHVLPAAGGRFTVQMTNPRNASRVTLPGKVLALHSEHDLALVKIDIPFTASPVKFSRNDEVAMGEAVTVIGNPGLGDAVLDQTMTVGIISNPKRDLGGLSFIQTNAAVNPGNSGGPIFDDEGNVIGVVTLKANIEAVGFAVPISRVRAFLKACLEDH